MFTDEICWIIFTTTMSPPSPQFQAVPRPFAGCVPTPLCSGRLICLPWRLPTVSWWIRIWPSFFKKSLALWKTVCLLGFAFLSLNNFEQYNLFWGVYLQFSLFFSQLFWAVLKPVVVLVYSFSLNNFEGWSPSYFNCALRRALLVYL